MKPLFLAMAMGLVAVPRHVVAAEAKALQLVPKQAFARTVEGHRAPFVHEEADVPDLDFLPHPESRRGSPSSCDGARTLCYDPTNGHIVYKPARQLMPDIPGLQRENISVRRDRIIFRYSF